MKVEIENRIEDCPEDCQYSDIDVIENEYRSFCQTVGASVVIRCSHECVCKIKGGGLIGEEHNAG